MNTLNTSPSRGVASTLAEIEARLKEANMGAREVGTLALVEHSASKLRFRVGPMKRADHEAWHSLRFVEEQQHIESGGAKLGAPLLHERSDEFLLCHAVWSEDGQQLPEFVAAWLLNGEGFGPSTYALLEAASAQNPPRGVLVAEIQKMWGATSTNLIFWRVIKEAGLFKMLLDRLAGNEEERAFAERELGKVDESLAFWEAAFDCEDIANGSDFETYSQLGNDDAVNDE